MTDKNLADERREYEQGHLSRADLPADPWLLFDQWLQKVLAAKVQDPTAMILASVDANGQPFQRTVLLKQVTDQGLIFFTNLKSRKAQQIEHNTQVSLLFPWLSLEKQVAVCGRAHVLDRAAVETYFHSRPIESQLAAWASKQSQPLSSRQELEANFERCRVQMAQEGLETPEFWGGFVVAPRSFEFWQGRTSRLHDRFIYERGPKAWSVQRLSP